MKKVLVFLLITATCNISFAGQKFVAPSGNNANPGTILLPYLTIQYALNQVMPGDTLFIRAGIYYEKITCTVVGTATQKIKVTNYPGEEVTVNGNSLPGEAILLLNNCYYLTIDGIAFENNYMPGAKGIHVKEEGDNIIINNCKVRNAGWTNDFNADPYSINPPGEGHGILINGRTTSGIKNIAVTNCTVYNIVTGNSEAITVVGNVSNFVIAGDTVYNTRNIGIVAAGNYSWAVNAGVPPILNKARNGLIAKNIVFNNRRINNTDAPAGIYADGADTIYILNNVVYNNGNGISAGCENAGFNANFINIANNIIYKNDNAGIVFGSNAALVKNSQVLGNTIFKDGSAALFNAGIILQNIDSSLIANNIIIPLSESHYGISIFGYTATNTVVDNNLIYRYNGTQNNLYNQLPPQFLPTNPVNTNPLFADTSLLNFRLTINSPAINIGSNLWPVLIDKDAGDSFRIVNGSIDIGAYERQDGGCPALFTIDNTMKLSGRFSASQKIIYNYDLVPNPTDSLLFSAAELEMQQSVNISKLFQVKNLGCGN